MFVELANHSYLEKTYPMRNSRRLVAIVVCNRHRWCNIELQSEDLLFHWWAAHRFVRPVPKLLIHRLCNDIVVQDAFLTVCILLSKGTQWVKWVVVTEVAAAAAVVDSRTGK